MVRYTLYAYVDGSDLHDVDDLLTSRFSEFIRTREWINPNVQLVNQRWEDDPSLGPGDMPDWNLGINFDLADQGAETPGWFADVESTVLFLAQLHTDTGRAFVVGIGDHESSVSEDVFFVEDSTPDLNELRQVLEVEMD